MAANPIPDFTLEEYFALEAASDRRWEYRDGMVVCMSGGTEAHYTIESNVHFQLRLALRGGPCRAYTADTPVYSPAYPTYLYPDASVACDPKFRTRPEVPRDMLINPVLVVEVLSKHTQGFDRGEKFELYKAIPDFCEYLLIEQTERRITHWHKFTGVWSAREVTEGVLGLVSLDCELLIADVYDGVIL